MYTAYIFMYTVYVYIYIYMILANLKRVLLDAHKSGIIIDTASKAQHGRVCMQCGYVIQTQGAFCAAEHGWCAFDVH
jgi:hypothetical protein